MKVGNLNVVKFPTASPASPASPTSPRPRNSKSRKKINKLLKLAIGLGSLSIITFLAGFEAAVIVGLGLIIGSKIIPDLLKPRS